MELTGGEAERDLHHRARFRWYLPDASARTSLTRRASISRFAHSHLDS